MTAKPDPEFNTHRPFLAGTEGPRTMGLGCYSCFAINDPVGGHHWVARLVTPDLAADPDFEELRESSQGGHLLRTAVEIVDIAVEHTNFVGIVEPDEALRAEARKVTAQSGNPVTGLRLLARRRADGFMNELRSNKEAARLTAFLP